MKYSEIKKVVVIGIGGRGAYYIVKFLNLLDIVVEGYDLKESERTKEIESWGVKINYRNPQPGEIFDCDFFIYTNDLLKELQEQIKEDNSDKEGLELGKFYKQIIKDFESGNMNESEIKAFKDSNIAPLFDIDTSKMRYIAITGTDGKTTTCTMIYHMLKDNGFKPALITTVAAYIGEEEIATGLHTTTPSSQELYDLLKRIETEQCTHVIIEATSHGLEQGRLAGLKFDTVGYTNITSEHLDYHGNWDSYCNAKALLIKDHLKDGGLVVLNKDDKSFEILSKLSNNVLTYSILQVADFEGKDIEELKNGINFELRNKEETFPITLPILGKYNVSNFLCSVAVCEKENITIEKMKDSIISFKTVKGRMEILKKEPYTVIVDYAHTSNAVENALKSARLMVKDDGKLIHVFGCAGRRDFYKRPEMGRISNELSDITILTAEDPRLENLEDINDQIEKGWREGKNKKGKLYRFDYMDKNVEVRRDAIKEGLELAKGNDVVIITGKAHEESLCFGQIEYPWNDIEESKKLIA
jgi:UDP-N-acetylmuramoyl-L-alanyl-D-glutamate--2,6-diaminopimelate ligase